MSMATTRLTRQVPQHCQHLPVEPAMLAFLYRPLNSVPEASAQPNIPMLVQQAALPTLPTLL
jgi:hypothetical protein